MSLDAEQKESPVVASADELVGWLARGERKGPPLVGLEHEKILYRVSDGAPVPYAGPQGVGSVFEGLTRFGWQPFRDVPGGPVIALTRGRATLSLEPGGQLELSGAPHATARACADENRAHLDELRQVAGPLGLGAAALGYRPFGSLADQHWMPKRRYEVMRRSLGARGALAHDMMLMTATGQVSVDWADEAECAAMFTLASRATPLFVALYANSPLKQGQPSGYLSWRSRVWTQVDGARTGFPPHAVDGGFSYRAYVDWALDAPLLFLRRDGEYLSPALTFRQFLAHGHDGQMARESDWVDHLSTLFPEVRLKRVLEFRSADCCSEPMTAGLAAVLRGLLYDRGAREAGLKLLPARTAEKHAALHEEAARLGLAAPGLAAQCVELLEIAASGLNDADAALLEPLRAQARSAKSPAVAVLNAPREPARLLAASALW
jgi:glutamate--cysteine ligase